MAVDTQAKRMSAQYAHKPWMGQSILPDGTLDQGDRQSATWVYGGILAGTPLVSVRRYVPWKKTVGRARWR